MQDLRKSNQHGQNFRQTLQCPLGPQAQLPTKASKKPWLHLSKCAGAGSSYNEATIMSVVDIKVQCGRGPI